MMIRIGWVVVAALAIGCGSTGDGGGPANVQGAVNGASFAAKDAISTDLQGGGQSEGAIYIGTAGGLCGVVSNGQWPAGSQNLFISVSDTDANGNRSSPSGAAIHTIAAGHSIASAHVADVTYVTLDGSCNKTMQHYSALAGTVTLTRAGGGRYAGSFDLSFGDPVDLTGTFDTAACSGYATFIQGDSPTCSQ
jgi:hypothetical protein